MDGEKPKKRKYVTGPHTHTNSRPTGDPHRWGSNLVKVTFTRSLPDGTHFSFAVQLRSFIYVSACVRVCACDNTHTNTEAAASHVKRS
jgi:hypothetical protein